MHSFKFIYAILSATGLSLFSISACADVDESVIGKTFQVAGPNCFSTALRVTGHYATFRAVGPEEFEAFLNLTCDKVDDAQKGDIGTYFAPLYSFTHAYVHLDQDYGLQKLGVDYLGPSPIEKQRLHSIDYVYYASKECRQYSPDISLCANTRAAYRCKKFDWSFSQELNKHQEAVLAWEKTMAVALENPLTPIKLFKIEQELDLKMVQLEDQLQSLLKTTGDGKIKEYLSTRIRSLQDQMKFLQIKNKAQAPGDMY